MLCLLEPLLLEPLMRRVGRNLLADKVRLGLAVKLHGIQRLVLMLLVLGVRLQLRLLIARHGRGVDVLERCHL